MNIIHWITPFTSCCIYNMNHHLCTLNMSQKLMSKSDTFRCSLNKSRNICDNKSIGAFKINNSKVRIECCKVIICNFRLCIGYSGKKCRFSDIRETYQSNVSDYLKLKFYHQLFCRLSRLCILRNLHSRCRKMLISKASFSTF